MEIEKVLEVSKVAALRAGNEEYCAQRCGSKK